MERIYTWKEKMGKTSDTENNKMIGILACCEDLRCRHFNSERGLVGRRKRRHLGEASKGFNVAS